MKLKKLVVLFLTSLFVSNPIAAELDKILEKGFIEFAVYEDFPPYSYKDTNGRVIGVDVDIAKAIAKKLEVQVGFKLSLADESMEDDLRNLVWKGHYLAGAPADVMLHAPYDINFAKSNDKVIFTQPYYREVVAFALNSSNIIGAQDLQVFTQEAIGVETATISDAYLLEAYGGELRENVKHYKTVTYAVDAMVKQEINAVMANRGELEYSLAQHEHDFIVTKLPTPGLSVEGWDLSAAISAKNPKLANKINEIIGQLKASGEIEAIFISHGLSFHPALSTQLLSNTKEE